PPMPMPLPKADPKPVLPVIPKADPKPIPLPPKPPVVTDVKPLPKIEPKVPTLPVKPEIKLPTPDLHPAVVHEKPKTGGPMESPKARGLKLPVGPKSDHAELAKIKPPVDLTKTKPEVVLGSKPPADFKVKPIKLDSIHVPKDAPTVEKLNITNVKNVTV